MLPLLCLQLSYVTYFHQKLFQRYLCPIQYPDCDVNLLCFRFYLPNGLVQCRLLSSLQTTSEERRFYTHLLPVLPRKAFRLLNIRSIKVVDTLPPNALNCLDRCSIKIHASFCFLFHAPVSGGVLFCPPFFCATLFTFRKNTPTSPASLSVASVAKAFMSPMASQRISFLLKFHPLFLTYSFLSNNIESM